MASAAVLAPSLQDVQLNITAQPVRLPLEKLATLKAKTPVEEVTVSLNFLLSELYGSDRSLSGRGFAPVVHRGLRPCLNALDQYHVG